MCTLQATQPDTITITRLTHQSHAYLTAARTSNRKVEGKNKELDQEQRRHTRRMVEASGSESIGGGGGGVRSGGDMIPSPIGEVDNNKHGGSSKQTTSNGGRAAERSARVSSAGGAGDGEWSLHSVHGGIDKRASLPKLEGRKGGRGRGRDGEGSSTSGEPEEPRASGKRPQSSRQRGSSRTPRAGAGDGADYGSPSSAVSSIRAEDNNRRGGSGDAERVARGRVGAESERYSHKDGVRDELEMSRTLLSSSSVSSPASIVASRARSPLASNENRIVDGPQVVVADGHGGSGEAIESSSEGGGRRARPPRLDL